MTPDKARDILWLLACTVVLLYVGTLAFRALSQPPSSYIVNPQRCVQVRGK